MSKHDLMPTGKLEATDPETGEIITVKAWAAVVPKADPDEYLDRVVEAIFTAESIEAAMGVPDKTEGLKDYIGTIITIHDARWSPSGFKRGPGAFYLLDITSAKDVEHHIVTTGATNVLAVVARAFVRGELPFSGRVVEVQSASNPENKIQYLVSTDAY